MWPDWAIFLNFSVTNFLVKVAQIFRLNLGLFEIIQLFHVKMIWVLYGQYWEKLSNFYAIIWSHWAHCRNSPCCHLISSELACLTKGSRQVLTYIIVLWSCNSLMQWDGLGREFFHFVILRLCSSVRAVCSSCCYVTLECQYLGLSLNKLELRSWAIPGLFILYFTYFQCNKRDKNDDGLLGFELQTSKARDYMCLAIIKQIRKLHRQSFECILATIGHQQGLELASFRYGDHCTNIEWRTLAARW